MPGTDPLQRWGRTGPSEPTSYKCLPLEHVQLSRLPRAWHTQLPGLPEPSALQVPRASPGPGPSALAGAPSTAGPPLSVVFNSGRGSTPSYSSILPSVKEHGCARREHGLSLSKLCRVFSLDHVYGVGPPGQGTRGSQGLAAGPACTTARGSKPHLCWWAPCVERPVWRPLL